ncbi:MAG: hypothetical protein AB1489_03715 [Acidobacteriota bacterium]
MPRFFVILCLVVVLLGCNTKTTSENSNVAKPESAKPETNSPQQQPKATNDNQISSQDVNLKTKLTRKWLREDAEDCFCNECLDIQFDKVNESFCVESNQIFVSAYYKLDEANKKVNIYFKDPTDLGRGGASLPWDKFDRDKPIAIIDAANVDKKTIKVEWIGFTEKGKEKEKQPFGEGYQGVYHILEDQDK